MRDLDSEATITRDWPLPMEAHRFGSFDTPKGEGQVNTRVQLQRKQARCADKVIVKVTTPEFNFLGISNAKELVDLREATSTTTLPSLADRPLMAVWMTRGIDRRPYIDFICNL